MKAKEIMDTKVITVSETATLRELNELLQRHKISAVPVINEQGKPIGIVTEAQLIRAILPSYAELQENALYLHDFEYLEDRAHHVEKIPVKEIMTHGLISVDEDTPILKVASIFLLRAIERLPVMRGERIVGIISRTDVCRAVFGEVKEEPTEIRPRMYTVLVSLAYPDSLKTMMTLATAIARGEGGEVLALHVEKALEPESPLLTEAVTYHSAEVPVHPLRRLGRDPGEGIVATAVERKADLLLLGWLGHTRSRGTLMGLVLDYVIEHTPCDLAVVRDRGLEQIRRILIPTAGGPHAVLAAKIALAIAEAWEATVTLLHVCRPGAGRAGRKRGERIIEHTLAGLRTRRPVERKLIYAEVVPGVIEESKDYDLVLVGATEARFFQYILFGNIPRAIAKGCPKTVMMVKRRIEPPLKSWLRRWFASSATGERS